ncbi:hypothetical protein BJX70DRAFT_384180 [Aspergillus crustosus]
MFDMELGHAVHTQERRFDKMDERLDEIDTQLEGVERVMNAQGRAIEGLQEKLSRLEMQHKAGE